MILIYEDHPIEAMIKKENKKIIRSIINELSPKHALIIWLKYWLNMPCDKIAKIIKSTPNSVRVTLHLIRKKLEVKIMKKGVDLNNLNKNQHNKREGVLKGEGAHPTRNSKDVIDDIAA
jgi:hypothetical protein